MASDKALATTSSPRFGVTEAGMLTTPQTVRVGRQMAAAARTGIRP